jgi:hypothetical protein
LPPGIDNPILSAKVKKKIIFTGMTEQEIMMNKSLIEEARAHKKAKL